MRSSLLLLIIVSSFAAIQLASCCQENKCTIPYYERNGIDWKRRNDTIECIMDLLDFNEDGQIDSDEFYQFAKGLMWPISSMAVSAWEKGTCDCGCDGKVSRDDFYGTYKTCLESSFKITMGYQVLCPGGGSGAASGGGDDLAYKKILEVEGAERLMHHHE